MCLHPISMYDTGRVNPETGLRILSPSPPKYALTQAPIPVPCGKCVLCLQARRNEWCKRMLLESLLYPVNSFVTLTYNDASLPWCKYPCKRHIQLFLKRFRQAGRDYGLDISNFRYFISSERGSLHGRPHYHAIFFGVDLLSDCWKPRIACFKDSTHPVYTSDVLSSIWNMGYVTVDRSNAFTVRYVSKYITKDDSWSLHSIHLGMRPYLHKEGRKVVGLSEYGLDTATNRVIALPSRSGAIKCNPPKALMRYLRRFHPSIYRDYLDSFKGLPLPDLGAIADSVSYKSRLENQTRKLDNEC